MALGLLLGALFTALGCDRDRDAIKPGPAPSQAGSAPRPSPAQPPRSRETSEPNTQARVVDAGTGGKLVDLAPPAPASASSRGVVLLTRDDELSLVSLTKPKLNRPADAFRVGRGPAIAGKYAYWTSKDRLVRRSIEGGALEVLAQDARSGTRVSALPANDARPAVAAFLATSGDSSVVRLWTEGQTTLNLTPEGAAASSVSLVATDKGVLAISLEGRTGMTPVHARSVRFDAGKPKANDDVVVWVAGGAQSVTEVVATSRDGDVWAFIPMERDITHFGLAQIHIGREPKMGAPVTWRGYENGLDPAPVATASACNSTWVVFARPREAKPRAPQELHLSELSKDGLGPSRVVARASAFADVSVADAPDGLLISYVAERRTWALALDCPTKQDGAGAPGAQKRSAGDSRP